jgi:hypothetical protein
VVARFRKEMTAHLQSQCHQLNLRHMREDSSGQRPVSSVLPASGGPPPAGREQQQSEAGSAAETAHTGTNIAPEAASASLSSVLDNKGTNTPRVPAICPESVESLAEDFVLEQLTPAEAMVWRTVLARLPDVSFLTSIADYSRKTVNRALGRFERTSGLTAEKAILTKPNLAGAAAGTATEEVVELRYGGLVVVGRGATRPAAVDCAGRRFLLRCRAVLRQLAAETDCGATFAIAKDFSSRGSESNVSRVAEETGSCDLIESEILFQSDESKLEVKSAEAVDEPAVDKPELDDPAEVKSAVVEPAVEDPAAVGGSAVDQAEVDEPADCQQGVGEPTADLTAVDELAVDEPVDAQPAYDQQAVDQPPAEEPAFKDPAVDALEVEQPKVDQPADGQQGVAEPTVYQPTVDQTAVDELAGDEPPGAQPAYDEQAVDQPSVVRPMYNVVQTRGKKV